MTINMTIETADDLKQMMGLVWVHVDRQQVRVLLISPRGTGTTMLARRMAHLVPMPSKTAAKEYWRIWSLAFARGSMDEEYELIGPPFRAPHHTISAAGMSGSARRVRDDPPVHPLQVRVTPGELSLAHGGTLLLDEIDEFSLLALNTIVGAARDKKIALATKNEWIELPAGPRLIIGTVGVDSRQDPAVQQRQLDRAISRTKRLNWDIVAYLRLDSEAKALVQSMPAQEEYGFKEVRT